MGTLDSVIPRRFGNAAMVPTFPQTPTTYADALGTYVIPPGSLNRWWAYRATKGAVRGEVIGIGDSTMWGSEGLYSFLQRLRDRSTAFGITDGGKGMFANGEALGITYDAPEVSGHVSSAWGGTTDGFDNTDGQFYFDNGAAANRQLVLQFRQSNARLWYSARAGAGDFTYSVDGGTAVTVKAYAATNVISKYVYISGLAPNTTHTITITNLAVSTSGGAASGASCWVALAPMNDTGLVWQKYATSGDTMNNRFYGQLATTPYTQSQYGMRYQTSFGLASTTVNSPTYRGAPVDSSQPVAGKINPVLAISNLGFNDLTTGTSGDLAMWTEYVKRFAGACADASCDGMILSGQLPYNAAHWSDLGVARYNALKTQAAASGLAWADLFYSIDGPSLSYAGTQTNPHLSKTQYQTQADWLWDNLLGLPA